MPPRRLMLQGLGCMLIAGCTGAVPLPDQTGPVGQAVAFDAPDMAIRGRYHPPKDASARRPLWVVIEGDGAVWHNGQPPRDPTPRHAVGPSVLSMLPPGDARLWLARPCQYLPAEELAACNSRYWTQARFSGPVLAAYQTLIDRHAAGRPVVLLGFSGGGVLAAELALTRKDVAGLVTLAAPLDLDTWTAYHGVPPLAGPRPSDRMLRGLSRLDIPALYIFGERDVVVPPAMLSRIRATLPADRVQIVQGAGHADDWAAILAPRLGAVTPPG